jgi:predicted metalloprotease with PDZ domain
MAMATQLRKWGAVAFIFATFPVGIGGAKGQSSKVPEPLIGNLGADAFASREKAQSELFEWSRKQPAIAIPDLYRRALAAEDPEIRARCLAVLKDVVIAQNYRAEGYLGIALQEVEVKVPTDGNPRRGVRITLLMEGTAAELGGLKVGDLIVGIDDQIWREKGMKDQFPIFIRKIKPGTELEVLLLEEGKIVRKKVTLGEKPAGVNPSTIEDLEAANRAAKELFFRRWLDKQEAVVR